MSDYDDWVKKKETWGVFNEESIPFLENRITETKETLKSRQVLDEKWIAELENLLDADEKRLKRLRTKQKQHFLLEARQVSTKSR